MLNYHHLLGTHGISKGLCIFPPSPNPIEQHYLLFHPQPESLSSYSHISRNKCGRKTQASNHDHFHSQDSLHTSKHEYPKHENEPPRDYHVIIKGREVILADHMPPAAHEYPLPRCNLNLLMVQPSEPGAFFCYKQKDMTNMPLESVLKTIKTSLAAVLSSFYLVAGEIVRNSQGEPEVVCNNTGVEFVHAYADIELKDLDFYHPDDSVKGKLVPKINFGVCSVQVTELSCGALIISCVMNHQLADAYSLNMFLVAWAKHARLKTISNIPSFRHSILNPRHPPRYDKFVENLHISVSSFSPPSSSKNQLQSRYCYIPIECINHIQSQTSSKQANITKFKAFTAFLWKLLAHRSDEGNKTSKMGIVVNGRWFQSRNREEKKSSLLENHFGNVLSIPFDVAENNDLQAMTLNEVASLVHTLVAKATKEEHFRGLIDWVELHRPNIPCFRIYMGQKESEGEAVVVSAGQSLPFKDMDFGWGKPEFGLYHFPMGGEVGYVLTMPSARKNGDWIVYMHLKQKDLDLIDTLAPHVFVPLRQSYLCF